MREREVVRAIAERLKQEGLNPQVRYSTEQGPDIEARLPSRRVLKVEAKGHPPAGRPQQVRTRVGQALLQLLSLYDDPNTVPALGLPYADDYERLVRRVLPALRHLGIHMLLVDRDRQVWHLGPEAPGFFPEKPQSLVEVLDR